MIKLTKQRKEIYNILKDSKKPMSAEMLFEKLPKNTMNLSTIYRSIDYFENNDLLLKFHFDGKSYYFLNDKNHNHYFICTKCLSMQAINCHLHNTINSLEKDYNFLVTNHEMTIYGICNLCH